MARLVKLRNVKTYRITLEVTTRHGPSWSHSEEIQAMDLDELLDEQDLWDRVKLPDAMEEFGRSDNFKKLCTGIAFRVEEIG